VVFLVDREKASLKEQRRIEHRQSCFWSIDLNEVRGHMTGDDVISSLFIRLNVII
jgi:hypothetical protein